MARPQTLLTLRASPLGPNAVIRYFNLGNGEVALGTSGNVPAGIKSFLIEQLDGMVLGGVRIDYICFYLPGDEAFAFAGGTGGGFGIGALGGITIDKTPFTLAGGTRGKGLGTVRDPLTGGAFVA